MRTRLHFLITTPTVILIGCSGLQSATIAWTNTGGGNWSLAANWDANQTPGPADTAVITNDGTYTVTLDVGATVDSLIVGGSSGNQILANSGTLTLISAGIVNSNGVLTANGGAVNGPLTVAGALNFQAGALQGLRVSTTGVMNINGGNGNTVYLQGALTNAGTVNWLSGQVYLYSCQGAGPLVNLAGGLWDIQCDQSLSFNCSGQPNGYFDNAGTVRKSASTGTTTIYIPFNNSGTVAALQGTLSYNGGGVIDGMINAAAGTVINFNGSFTSGAAPVLNGPGAIQFTAGTLTLLSDVIPNLQMLGGTLVLGPGFQGGTITNLALNGMTLSGNYTVSGTFNWQAGSITGPLRVSSTGVMNINGGNGNTVYLQGALTNAGTVNWLSGQVYLYSCQGAGPLVNLAGGLWDIQCDQSLSFNCSGQPNGYFDNAGTVRKSASTGTTTIYIPFNNSGTVAALQGTLSYNGGGVIDGMFNAAAGTVINFNGSFTSGAAPVLNGPGAIQFTAGTLTLLSDVIPNLQMLGGTLVLGPGFQGGTITNLALNGMTLSGNYTVSGTFNWQAGSITGPLRVSSTGVMNINGGNGNTVYLQGALTNAGTVNWLSGQVYLYSCQGAGPLVNLAGGLWDIQCDQSLSFNCSGQPNGYFDNAGTVRKSASTGTTTIYIPFNNSGTVAALQGTLSYNGGGVIDGMFNAAAGTVINFNGSFTSGAAPVLNGPGAIQFTAGTLTLLSDVIPNLQMLGGTLVLGPGFQGGTITNLALNGMTLSGNYTVSGTFNWQAGSITGPLRVSSTGVMNINGGNGNTVYLQGALTNAGTVNWLSGQVYLYSCQGAGPLVNLAGGLWDIQCDQSLSFNCSGQPNGYFDNAGTVRKSASTGTTTIYIPFNNSGTVAALQGTLSYNGGGVIDGMFNAAAGTVINFNGSFTSGAAPVLNGPGAIQFTAGTLTLLSDVIPNLQMLGGTLVLGPGFQGGTITNLALNGMTLSGNYTVSGTFNWQAGSITGPLRVSSTGVMNINGGNGNTVYLQGALTNAGTVNWLSGQVYLYSCQGAGPLVNLAGGLWDIQCDQSLSFNCSGQPNGYFDNAGTVRKSASTGTTTIYIPFNNSGTVAALQGTLSYNGGGVIDGMINAAAGTVINFNGSFTSGAAPVLNGPGAIQFTGGTLTLLSDVIPNLQMLGGTLVLGPGFQGGTITNLALNGMTLSGNYTVSGTFNWQAGSITGPLRVSSTGVMNINGGNGNTVYLQGALTNAGTVNWLSGQVYLYSCQGAGPLVNLAGGLWDIQCDQSLSFNCSGQPNGYFDNAGTVRKSASTGTTTIYIPFNNSGTVAALQGTLSYNGGGVIDGMFNAAAGTVINFNGSFTSGAAPVLNGPGAIQFTAGTLTLLSDVIPNLQMLGGTLVLGPGFQGGTITNLALNGMTLSGDYTVSGTFNWQAGSITGPLRVSSTGVMNINGGNGNTVYLQGALTNAGTVNWLSGQVYLYSCQGAGPLVNLAGGLWDIQCDQSLSFNCSGQPNGYFDNAGTVRKSASTGTTAIYIPFNNSGTVAANAGTLGFNSTLLPTGGELRFGLRSLSDFGRISIAGNAALDGTIGVAWLDGFVPATGDLWTVLTYGSYSTIFTNINLPAAALWATNYGPTFFTVEVAAIDKLAFTTQPSGGRIPGATLAPIVVQVQHPIGVPVATNGVPITLSLGGGAGVLSGTLTRNTDPTGKATFDDLSVNFVGVKQLRAAAPDLTPAISMGFAIVPRIEVRWTVEGLRLRLNAPNDLAPVVIYASTNLESWTPIYTNPPVPNPIDFLDFSATNFPSRFYRAVEQ